MRPDTLHEPRKAPLSALSRLPAAWASTLGWLALAWGAALLLTGGQWIDMAGQWLGVSAYQHILFVPPIIGWLVWNRREVLAGMVPRAWWPGLPMVIGALFVWLVGALTSLDLIAQAGAVLILQAVTLALLGPRIGAVLAFPLFFAVFLVPFGEEIVGPLQMLTAEMAIGLTHLSGISAEIDGVFIDTPAGLFEVAEACAGVQFVVAMVTLGVLAAKVGMERWQRRIGFMALCVVVPIVANGIRAWGIIAIAQYVGAERAGGIDHIFYGWFFFAIVVALVTALAWRWFDRDPEAEARSAARLADHTLVKALDRMPASASTLAPLIAAIVLLFGLWGGLARANGPALPELAPPEVPGWALVEEPSSAGWQPQGATAVRKAHWRYRNADAQVVDVYLAAYTGDGDPTVAAEGAVPPDTEWRRVDSIPAPSGMFGEELLAYGVDRRLAWTSYVVDNIDFSDPLKARLASLDDRLLVRAKPRWLVIVSVPGGASEATILDRFHSTSRGPASLVDSATNR